MGKARTAARLTLVPDGSVSIGHWESGLSEVAYAGRNGWVAVERSSGGA